MAELSGGEEPISFFRKKEIESKLNEGERKVFNNFLRKMRELGIIVPDIEGGRGSYNFVNELYPVYIRMENQHFKETFREVDKMKLTELLRPGQRRLYIQIFTDCRGKEHYLR